METLTMSQKERNRIPVMKAIGKHELKLAKAAELLGMSYRQTRRIWRRYLAQGDAGLVHPHSEAGRGLGARKKLFATRCWRVSGIGIQISGPPWRRSIWQRSMGSRWITRRCGAGSMPRGCASPSLVARRIGHVGSAALVLGRWCNLTGRITIGLRGGERSVV